VPGGHEGAGGGGRLLGDREMRADHAGLSLECTTGDFAMDGAELGMGVVRTPKSSTRLFVANVERGDLAEHVDDRALVVEEHHPAERVDPRFLRGGADGGPGLL